MLYMTTKGLPWWLRWYRILLQCRRPEFDPWVGMIPRRREWLPCQYSCLENPHGQRSLKDYSPWGHKELDMIESLKLSLFFFLNYESCCQADLFSARFAFPALLSCSESEQV